MPQYQRPDMPYAAVILPNSDRYSKVADNNQSPSGQYLDGDFDYIIDSMNALYVIAIGIAAGILPGAINPVNINKFPITDGANPATISWSKIIADHFSANCIPTAALQVGCATEGVLGDGSVTNLKIRQGAVQNNNINDNVLSFNKILVEDNEHFQEFFNAQDDGSLSGAKLEDGSIPAPAIADNSLPGTKVTDNSLPAAKLVNNSLTRAQLAAVIQPLIGSYHPWGAKADRAVPAGYVEANGQLLNRTTYALLFNEYGITYGAGDGTTTFGTPDLRGRALFGIDPNSGSPTGGRIVNGTIAVGGTSGEEMHQLTVPEMPAHGHGYDTPFNSGLLGQGGSAIRSYNPQAQQQTDNTGGDTPHNNMPPYMLSRVLIYAGV